MDERFSTSVYFMLRPDENEILSRTFLSLASLSREVVCHRHTV
jgi:hypothetical protein